MTTTLERPTTATVEPQRPTFGSGITELPLLDPPTTPAPPQRALSQATDEELFSRFGPIIGGFALAWLICYRLLPWNGLVGYLLVSLVCILALTAVVGGLRGGITEVQDRVMNVLVPAGALIVFVALASAVIFTFYRGFEALLHVNIYTQDMSGIGPKDSLDKGGVLHAIVGSLIEVFIAIAIVVPLGIGTAVFMTEVGGPYAKVVRTVVESMTALPSIVAGLFIYTTVILTGILPKSGAAAALAIGVMMLPIIARAADVVLRVVPGSLREASLALGASRWKTVWHVVLPTARPGLATAVILGVARGVGETSPLLLTSGVTSSLKLNPFDGVMTSLPLFIFSTVRSGEPIYEVRGFGAAAILMTLVLLLFTGARLLARPRRDKSRTIRAPRQTTPQPAAELPSGEPVLVEIADSPYPNDATNVRPTGGIK
ncbi:phosphate ABC transporter permease PstA [Kribbia dieselivorans]|uniref:phosphate ABC transporter permease PstA n=1 Tax=Kribbia dieselivorans TaxID=331526 RepID=UPI0009FA2F5A|nr:phosphate ABC transporter permease PstA [Kribbia dieselivorans]